MASVSIYQAAKPFAKRVLPVSVRQRILGFRNKIINSVNKNDDHRKNSMISSSECKKKIITIAPDDGCRAIYELMIAAIRQDNINVIRGGATQSGALRINVHLADRAAFLAAIEPIIAGASNAFILVREDHRTPWAEFLQRQRSDPFDVAICRLETSSDIFVSRIEVTYWRQIERFSGLRIVPNRPTYGLTRVADFSLLQGYDDLSELKGKYHDPTAHNFPVDFVYTWVDGDDPEWLAEKARYSGDTETHLSNRPNYRAQLQERFRSRDELKYSLRSVEMFAPYVRKIYLVTAGHVPRWLKRDHPKIIIISHEDIYSNPKNLPTFNSSGIETQLHHIPGLSENFVYFNDDMMLGRPTNLGDFFTPNGAAVIYPSDNHFVPEVGPKDLEEYAQADVNAVRMFRERYGLSPTALMQHVPYAAKVSVLDDLEQEFGSEFERCASNRFRSMSDLRPIAFMQPHFACYRREAVPGVTQEGYFALWYSDIEEKLAQALRSRHFKFLCLNDAGVPSDRIAEVDRIVSEFLESYFPVKSSFEL